MNFGGTQNRLLGSLVLQIVGKSLSVIAAIGTSSVVARYLGPSGLGELAFAIAITSLIVPISNLGMRNSVNILLKKPRKVDVNTLCATGLGLEVLGSAIAIAVFTATVALFKINAPAPLIAYGLLANLLCSSEIIEVGLLHARRGGLLGIVDVAGSVTTLLLSVLLVFVGAPLIYFGALPCVKALARTAILAVGAIKNKTFSYSPRLVNRTTAKELLKCGFPLMVSSLMVVVFMKIDQIMIGWYCSSTDLGIYAVATSFSELLYFLPVVISSTIYPYLRDGSSETSTYAPHHITFKSYYRLSWTLGILICIACFILSPFFVSSFFGPMYESAISCIKLLAPAAVAVTLGLASSSWLTINGWTSFLPIRSFIGAGSNIVLNYLLIPRYGIQGAAVATTISYFCSVFGISMLRYDIRTHLAKVLLPL